MYKKILKLYLLILLPFIYGYLILSIPRLFEIDASSPLFFSILFIIFWFWIGTKFAALNTIKKIYSILLGNSITIISSILYIVTFYVINEKNRNIFLYKTSQYYAAQLNYLGGKIVIYLNGIYDVGITGGRITLPTKPNITVDFILVSYVLIFIIFCLGFLYKQLEQKYVKSKKITFCVFKKHK